VPELVLAVLKYFFLLLIFLFLVRAVRAMYLEILGPRASRQQSRPAGTPRIPARTGRPPDKVTVTPADGKAMTYDISEELLIGRDSKCQIPITDSYASTIHARIFKRDNAVLIEDMGSTNGTFLNRKKLSVPAAVSRGDKARIGRTELEFKK